MSRKNATKKTKPKTAAAAVSPDPLGLRKGKTLQELIAEQGVKPVENVEDLAAPPGSLWSDDADLDEFLSELRGRRREGG